MAAGVDAQPEPEAGLFKCKGGAEKQRPPGAGSLVCRVPAETELVQSKSVESLELCWTSDGTRDCAGRLLCSQSDFHTHSVDLILLMI